MGKDRIVIIVCLVLMVALLSSAATLMQPIDRARAQLQLTAHDDVMENMPPEIAFTQAALGSFRGLAVNVLWGRVQQMQAEGKLYEAMQLSDWITKLQPRFTQVWIFHAWNMAYNISVTTATPQERWMWVQEGVRLLRDNAIPLNPKSVELHRQLGWIYLHKIGMYSDEMHQYYKAELASQWHTLLGEPPRGTETEEVLAWFEPIADMFEAYVNDRELGYAVREELDRLDASAGLDERVDEMRGLTIQQLETRLISIMDNEPDLAETFGPLRELVDAQLRESRRRPVQRLRQGDAEVAAQLDRLRERGFRPDEEFLRRVARIEAARSSVDMDLLGVEQPEVEDADQWLQEWLDDAEIAEARRRLLAFTRARVVHEQYRMNPIWMYELMKGAWVGREGDEAVPVPIDWRHPAAHGAYWSSLGVRRRAGLLRPEDFTVLNTDRQVIHSLQELYRSGDIVFDPATKSYRTLPDPRYIDAYHAAVFGASERQDTDFARETVALESFRAGHENFLSSAVQQSYFYGEMAQARRYYRMLREMYSDAGPDRAERYQQPLEDFVTSYFLGEQTLTLVSDARAAVTGPIMQAIEQGLANGRGRIAERYLQQARRVHRFYNSERAEIANSESGDRLSLPSYGQMLSDTFRNYLQNAGAGRNPLAKARAWQNAPVALKRRVWDDVQEPLHRQAEQMGLDPANMFAEPEGMEDYRAQRGEEEDESDGIDIQSLPEQQ